MIPKDEAPKSDPRGSQKKSQDKGNGDAKLKLKNPGPPTKYKIVLIRCKNTIRQVIVRHLPSTMTRESFIEEVSPLPKYDYLSFVNSDPGLGQFAFSRAYINFCNQEDIYIFTEKFDGYIFVDGKGDEHSAIVEFAPFQKAPKKGNRKKDHKCGTIENDSDYLKFLESLEKNNDSETPPSSAVENLEEINAKEREMKALKNSGKATTPLLDYLRKKKEDKIRMREERKEEKDKKRAEKKKAKDEDKKKQKEKRLQEKPKIDKSEKTTPKIVIAKPKDTLPKEAKEEELTRNLKEALKIAEEKEPTNLPEVAKKEHQSSETKKHHSGKDHKSDSIKKKDFKKKYQGSQEEKKSAQPDGDKSETKKKSNPRETKSYKEERQKMKEARAARAAAKQDGAQSKSAPATETAEQSKTESEDTASSSKVSSADEGSSKPNRVRNKDRPAMPIYRPGMWKKSDTKPNSDGTDAPSSAKHVGEEIQKQTKSRTFTSRSRKPVTSEQQDSST